MTRANLFFIVGNIFAAQILRDNLILILILTISYYILFFINSETKDTLK